MCTDVENKIGIWLEPSIQGGRGGIWFYSTEDDSVLADDYDYQEYIIHEDEDLIALSYVGDIHIYELQEKNG